MTYHREDDTRVFSSDGDVELSFKMGPKKPKLETVTMMDWTAANAKIMAKLLLEGKLATKNTAQYLSYTVKIAGLCRRYMWQSVMLYDREYRRSQAIYNFPWGSDIQHLVTTHLVPRYATGKSSKADKGQYQYGSTQSPELGLCKLFNHSVCTYGDSCKYRHVCNVCKGSHPQSKHQK